jgi:hypothetical protein
MAKHPRLRVALTIAGVVVGLLLAAAAVVYLFGTMQPPSAESRAAYAQLVMSGQATPVAARFGVPVPGCICHSPDPVLQVQHSTRYFRDCTRCHEGGRPQ